MADNPGVHVEKLEELSAYYGGDLSPEAAAAFEAHLAECERCRETLRVMRTAIKPEQTDAQAAQFETMVTDKRARDAEIQRVLVRRLWGALAVAAVLGAVGLWAFLRMAGEPVNTGGQVYEPPQPRIDAG